MKFTVYLSESEEAITHVQTTLGGVVTDIQESLIQLAVNHAKKNYHADASFVIAELDFLKEFESDLFYEFANKEHEHLHLYRYILDTKGRRYDLNYYLKIERN